MAIVSDPQKVRQSHFAAAHNGFYPDDPVALTKQLAELFRKADRAEVDGAIAAIIAPHAGYAYSGAVAAAAYKQIQGLAFDTVVVIAPSHRAFFRGAAVYSGGAYRTPLGDVRVDLDFCRRLTAFDPVIALSDLGHDATGGGWEHSLEVHLPFLQIVLGQFALVPVVMGDQEYQTAKKLGEHLARLATLDRTLIVASSDLAHGHPYDVTRRLDDTAAAAVEEFFPPDFYDQYASGAFEACGGGPMTAAMIAARAMGADRARVIDRCNSADVTGERTGYIVGYLSAVMYQSSSVARSMENRERLYVPDDSDDTTHARPGARALLSEHFLSPPERDILRTTARRSIERAVKGAKFECPTASSETLRAKRGAFVTLRHHGALRGCIGYVRPYKPLIDAVWEMAESAATRDPRFVPVSPAEVDELEIEITALSPLLRISNPDDVLVGRHGAVVTQGHRTGVLLPQVPLENDWDRETFLTHVCRKADLPDLAWRDPKTTIEVFTAEVF